jgi:hypothetical protein
VFKKLRFSVIAYKRIVPITNTPYSGAFSERMKRREPAIPMMSPATRASPALRP